MNIENTIKALERAWDLEYGFLGNLRQGYFDHERLEDLIRVLQSVELSGETKLEKRFVSLTWYISIFLTWQRERFIEEGKDTKELDMAINKIEGILEGLLGIP